LWARKSLPNLISVYITDFFGVIKKEKRERIKNVKIQQAVEKVLKRLSVILSEAKNLVVSDKLRPFVSLRVTGKHSFSTGWKDLTPKLNCVLDYSRCIPGCDSILPHCG
jgi:hypothetical protein